MSALHPAATSAAPVFKGDLLNDTYYPTLADTSNSNKQWYIIDAKGQRLGRLATLAATYIRYAAGRAGAARHAAPATGGRHRPANEDRAVARRCEAR